MGRPAPRRGALVLLEDGWAAQDRAVSIRSVRADG